ncbi:MULTISPECIES: glycosyltransferase family 10 domain-containing protein [unclassified Helicobacter]|uniref:glycosyltransferase family 10 domain-containing protein n=1 Tax=unclassified Helicobacter TaxID=2593540 RepID=UPI0015F14D42|nr:MULTISPECIES: glycosyltransferase family 10 [unclassified Helicobacter]
MKQIKLRIVDWWLPDTKEVFKKNFFVKFLREMGYEVVYSDEPEYILYSVFGEEYTKYDCVRIFYSGENTRANFADADYAIDFDFLEYFDRHLRLPLAFWEHKKDAELAQKKHIWASEESAKREKFCAFMVTNPATETSPRGAFFEKLSVYKKVDSGGNWRNNIGGPIGDRYGDYATSKREWLKGYKFNLCFENSSYPGYMTEKLIQAFSAGCIPIYWGDTSLRCGLDSSLQKDTLPPPLNANLKDFYCSNQSTQSIQNPDSKASCPINQVLPQISLNLLEYKINPKAYINAHNFPTWEALVDEIKRIDNDERAYLAMLKEPMFLDNFNAVEFYQKRLEEFFHHIFSQPYEQAFRRGVGVCGARKQIDVFKTQIGNAVVSKAAKLPKWLKKLAKKILKISPRFRKYL